jgi:hypothetical protein
MADDEARSEACRPLALDFEVPKLPARCSAGNYYTGSAVQDDHHREFLCVFSEHQVQASDDAVRNTAACANPAARAGSDFCHSPVLCKRQARHRRERSLHSVILDTFPANTPASVRCRVYPLRRRGRRLPWREVSNAPSFEGDLSTHYLTLMDARYFVATLVAPGDAHWRPLLPELYEPVLTTIGNGTLVLRGFEREGEAATVQEWRCEIHVVAGQGAAR